MTKPQISQMTQTGLPLGSLLRRTVASALCAAHFSVRSEGDDCGPNRQRAAGFTMIELLIVMALLALVAGLSVPMLSHSLRQRNLAEEATRFVALTEYARNEAVSQGIPMVVWVDSRGQRFGVEPREGFEGDPSRNREFALHPDVTFKINKVALAGGVAHAVEYSPDGSPSLTSVATMEMADRSGSVLNIMRTEDLWSYEISKESR